MDMVPIQPWKQECGCELRVFAGGVGQVWCPEHSGTVIGRRSYMTRIPKPNEEELTEQEYWGIK